MITIPYFLLWLTVFGGAAGLMMMWLQKRPQPKLALALAPIQK